MALNYTVTFKPKFGYDVPVTVKPSFKTFGDIHKQYDSTQVVKEDTRFSLTDFRRVPHKMLNEDDFIKDSQTIQELGIKAGSVIYVVPKTYKK